MDEAGDAEAGAGADDHPRCLRLRPAAVQAMKIVGVERGQPVRSGGEVVEQADPAQSEAAAQRIGVEPPGQVGQLRRPAVGRAGDAEGGRGNRRRAGEKVGEQAVEVGEIGAGVALATNDLRPPGNDFGKCQQGLGAAQVAAEDHDYTATGAAMCGCGS